MIVDLLREAGFTAETEYLGGNIIGEVVVLGDRHIVITEDETETTKESTSRGTRYVAGTYRGDPYQYGGVGDTSPTRIEYDLDPAAVVEYVRGEELIIDAVTATITADREARDAGKEAEEVLRQNGLDPRFSSWGIGR